MATVIEKKLVKILALAERGIDGEKVNARFILEKLLKKHELTLDDILKKDNQELIKKGYRYKNKMEKTLLVQIYVSITNINDVRYWKRRNASIIGFELTAIDHIELSEMYGYYKKLLKEEISCIVDAFIQKHELYSSASGEESSGDKTVDIERLQRIRRMMANMQDSSFVSTRKRLKA